MLLTEDVDALAREFNRQAAAAMRASRAAWDDLPRRDILARELAAEARTWRRASRAVRKRHREYGA